MLKFIRQILLGISAVVFITSCDRVTDEPKSKLVIELPSISSKALEAMDATNLPNEVFITLSNLDHSLPRHIRLNGQNSFEIEVSKGENKVLQVLAVYPGILNTPEVFHGSTQFVADQDEVVIKLSLSSLGPIVTGEISGRILNSSNLGPTGNVIVAVQISPNLAPMEIEQTPIIGGWFKAMGIAADNIVGVDYKYQSQTKPISLFGGPKKLTDFTANESTATVYIPRHQVPDGNSNFRAKEPKLLVVGMWKVGGDSYSDRHVYNEAIITGFNSSSLNLKPLNCKKSDQTCSLGTTPFDNFSFSSAIPVGIIAELNKLNETNSLPIYYQGNNEIWRLGGVGTHFDDDQNWQTWLKFTTDQWVTGNDNSITGDFRGAFRYNRATGPLCASSTSCQGFMLPSQSYLTTLPGITANSVQIFYKPLANSNNSNSHNEQLSCSRNQLLSSGFLMLKNVTINPTGNQITLPKANLEANAQFIVICGTFNNQEISTPILIHRKELNLPNH